MGCVLAPEPLSWISASIQAFTGNPLACSSQVCPALTAGPRQKSSNFVVVNRLHSRNTHCVTTQVALNMCSCTMTTRTSKEKCVSKKRQYRLPDKALRSLHIGLRPELDAKGGTVLVPNPDPKPYRFKDGSQSAPTGFEITSTAAWPQAALVPLLTPSGWPQVVHAILVLPAQKTGNVSKHARAPAPHLPHGTRGVVGPIPVSRATPPTHASRVRAQAPPRKPSGFP